MTGTDDADGGREIPTITFKEVSKVDLSALGSLAEPELRRHFAGVAAAATTSQLRLFLDGQTLSGLGDETHAQLADRFVARRMGVVRDLLEARDRANRNLDRFLGPSR